MTILRRSSKGQMLVWLAIALPAMLAALALCCDMSVMYINWQAMQKAADAAVLAGGAGLPDDLPGARSNVSKFLQRNGVDTATEMMTGYPAFANDNTEITVQLQRTVPYLFGRVVGLFTAPLQVSATAQIQNTVSATDVFPAGLDATVFPTLNFPGSVPYNIFSDVNSAGCPGCKGVIDLDSNPPYPYMDPANAFSGTLKLNQTLTAETGCKSGQANPNLAQRIADGKTVDPPNGGTWDNHTPGNPLQVVIPVGTFGAGQTFTITRFVNAWIDPATTPAAGTCLVNVYLIPGVAASTGTNGTVCTSSAASPGFCQVVLIR